MRHYLVLSLILICCLAGPAGADSAIKQVQCQSPEVVFRSMKELYHERPLWHGVSLQAGMALMLTVNDATGAWSLIEYNENLACVLAVGEGYRLDLGMSI
jgi:hypothetical protein